MAQSYGNSSISPLLAPVDQIVGVQTIEQQLGTSISGVGPTSDSLIGLTLAIKLDHDGASQTITLAAADDMYNVAVDIETKVRALIPVGPAPLAAYTGFTCRYDDALDQLILTSGTASTSPSTSACQITAGTAEPQLHLGTANGGSEAFTGSEVIAYNVMYQFVFNAGASFGGTIVTINSSEIATPTNVSQAVALANKYAAQIKAQLGGAAPYIPSTDNSQNGPVNLVL